MISDFLAVLHSTHSLERRHVTMRRARAAIQRRLRETWQVRERSVGDITVLETIGDRSPTDGRPGSTRSLVTGPLRLDNAAQLAREVGAAERGNGHEVLADAVDRWGVMDTLQKAIGEWSIAICLGSDELVAVRDRLGLHSVFYCRGTDYVAVSSSLLCLKDLLPNSAPDPAYFREYLHNGTRYPLSRRTPFKEVNRVRPGCYLTFSNSGNGAETRYWKPEKLSRLGLSTDSELAGSLFQVLEQAVVDRIRGERRIWCDFSGGLDSTSVARIAHDTFESVGGEQIVYRALINPGFPEFSEDDYIRECGRNLGVDVQYKAISHKLSLDVIGTPVYKGIDDPNMSLLNLTDQTELVEGMRQNGARVNLTGHGADHLLTPPSYRYMRRLLFRFKWGRATKDLREWVMMTKSSYFHWLIDAVFFPNYFRARNPVFLRSPRWLRLAGDPEQEARLDGERTIGRQKFACEEDTEHFRHILTGALQTSAAVAGGKAFGIETRPAYCDSRLVEFILRIRPELRLRPPLRKHLLRGAMKDKLPDMLLGKWRQPGGGLQMLNKIRSISAVIDRLLSSSRLGDMGLIDVDQVKTAFEGTLQGDVVHVMHFCRYITAELWLDRFAGSSEAAQSAAAASGNHAFQD